MIKQLQAHFYQTLEDFDTGIKKKILVLGIGNFLMGDEGVGVHTIHALAKESLPDYVDILDGATGSFDLMPILAKYPVAIFIDSTMDGRKPGTIDTIYPKFAKDFPTVLSAHDVGLKDMIDALEFKGELPRIVLITVTIAEIIPMTVELSSPIQEVIPAIVEKVKWVVEEMKPVLRSSI